MSENEALSVGASRPRAMGKIVITGLALAVALAVAVVLIFRFIADERARDLLSWQSRLGIVADSRANAVDKWYDRQFAELTALSVNPSLALYMTQIKIGQQVESAEAGYLRNLLTVIASRTGFTAPAEGPRVRANVKRIGVAGLSLFDRRGRLLVGTVNLPPMEGELRRFVGTLDKRFSGPFRRARSPAYMAPSGELTMAFAVPVYAAQIDPKPGAQAGFVLGVKPVAGELFPLLRQPGNVEKTAEVLLVRRAGEVVEYLSPLKGGSAPLSRKLALNTPNLAAAWALDHVGGFAEKIDYRGRKVLVTSRAIPGLPWVLVHKVDAAEALGPSEARLKRLLIILLLVVALVGAAIIAVWYKGASYRAGAANRRLEEMAAEMARQRDFLRLVTDSQPNANAIIDKFGHYRFANQAASRNVGMEQGDMLGKNLTSVLGPIRARQYDRLNREAMEEGTTVTALHRFDSEDGANIIQSLHVPIAESPEMPEGVLLIEEDITRAIVERERRERIMRQLVDTLVTVVDRRDPHASEHSRRVARVARAIAQEMSLDSVMVDTAEIAGEMMNVGKIMVPTEMLTRAGKLTAREIKQVRSSMQMSADLLDGIDFDGPVVETLRQCQERWDGQGEPRGLKERQIVVTAGVIAAANAFVALVSPRAHRPGIPFDKAIDILMGDAGKAYDRRAVIALVNYLDNRGGRENWANLLNEPARDAGGDGADDPASGTARSAPTAPKATRPTAKSTRKPASRKIPAKTTLKPGTKPTAKTKTPTKTGTKTGARTKTPTKTGAKPGTKAKRGRGAPPARRPKSPPKPK